MKIESVDTYAMVNPALGAILINGFVSGYINSKEEGCFFPIIYFVLPIILSNKINRYFRGTNKRTGLINWIVRNPEILIDMKKRVENLKKQTNQAFILGVQTGLFEINASGYIISKKKIAEVELKKMEHIYEYWKNSEKIGFWAGGIKEEKDLFYHLGVTL